MTRYFPAIAISGCLIVAVTVYVGPLGVLSQLLISAWAELMLVVAIDLLAALGYERVPESARGVAMLAARRSSPSRRDEYRRQLEAGLELRRHRPAGALSYAIRAIVVGAPPKATPASASKLPPPPRPVPPKPRPRPEVQIVPSPGAAKSISAASRIVVTAVLCLVLTGIVIVGDAVIPEVSSFYQGRQIFFAALGLLFMLALARVDTRRVRQATPLLLGLSLTILMVTLIPGVGLEVNGASRYVGVGGFLLQSAQLATLALALYGAHLLAQRPMWVSRRRATVPYLLICWMACALTLLEPDPSLVVLNVLVALSLLLAAGARPRHLVALTGLLLAVGAMTLGIGFATGNDSMAQATESWTGPAADFQSEQATIAIGSGRIVGRGLNGSVQRYFYLPEAHTTMIAAILGEELGLIGICWLIWLYLMLAYGCLQIARLAPDAYSRLLVVSLASLVLVGAVYNLMATFGLLPIIGMLLPFVSYSNTSLLISCGAIGLILAVARKARAMATSAAAFA